MSKFNMFDRIRRTHLKDTKISVGNDSIYINPKIKLILAWSIFALLCVVLIVVIKLKSTEKPEVADTEDPISTEEAFTPYEKDAYPAVNELINKYYQAIAACDAETLKTLVTNPEQFDDITKLQNKAVYIKGYNNLVCYTKPGYTENSMVVFAQTNIMLKDVASEPFDIYQFYLTIDSNGNYLINNGELDAATQAYIEEISKDQDILTVFSDAESCNVAFKNSDETLVAFYDLINSSTAPTTEATTEEVVTEEVTTEATTEEISTEATTETPVEGGEQDEQ